MYYLKSKTMMAESITPCIHFLFFSALIYWRDEEDDNADFGDFGGSYATSAHDRRKRSFLLKDPVHTTNLMTFMKEHLGLVQTNVGGVELFQEVCLRNVDEALVDQMHTMLL
jgi:hypothetical protein